jgi:hypothetical protein
MREPGRIHAATIEGSARLRAVLAFLKARGQAGATTREIIQETGYCAINSIISELRECGERITCTPEGKSPTGSAVYRYRLEAAPSAAQGELFGQERG